jgi:two-component system, cell cycle response regulator
MVKNAASVLNEERTMGSRQPRQAPRTVTKVAEALSLLAQARWTHEAEAALQHAERELGEDLETLRPLIETLMERVRDLERLHALSVRDELTGLANRRGFEQALKEAESRRQRFGEPFAVVLLDLDGLKQINDVHGHTAGDAAIRALARACRESVRPCDLAARLGGDEFAIVLAHADERTASTVADRIRADVEKQQVAGTWLGVSVGVAAVAPGEGNTVDAVIDAVDAAMYADKRARKQRPALAA